MNAPQKVGNPTPDPSHGIAVDETTKPDDNVVSLIRAEMRRAQRLANERDLMRALYSIRPDPPEAA